MNRKRIFTVVVGLLLAMIIAPPVQAQANGAPQKNAGDEDTHLYMQAKLANCEKVLEGLVTENYSSIEDGARKMKRISKAAHWPTAIDEVYQHYSFEFRRQCDKLVEQAERQDLRAAHYTYLHLSTTCVDCHRYVRRRFRVERPQKARGPIQLIPTEWEGQNKKKTSTRPGPDDGTSDKKAVMTAERIGKTKK